MPTALCLLAMSEAGAQSGPQLPAGNLSLSLAHTLPETDTAAHPAQDSIPQGEAPIILHPAESIDPPKAGNSPETANPPETGGSLQVQDSPTQQELLERAKYWESHGRDDLAAKLRSRIQPAAPERAAPATPAPETRRPAPPAPMLDARPAAVPVGMPVAAPAPAPSNARDTLDDQARYWEEHGREDLAKQIRKKLQDMGPPPLDTAATARRQAADAVNSPGSGAQSALETSLLKDPNSLGTRLDLAQIYRSTGELAKARAQVESVLAASPDLPPALFASAQLYADQHQWRAALDTLEKIPPASRTPEMASLQKTAWAHVQLDRADALVKQGRNAEAEVLLRRVALELSLDFNQPPLAEPPPLWKPPQADNAHKKR